MISSQGHLTVSRVPRVPCVLRSLSQKIFQKLINVQIRQFKKFHCPSSKISLHYQSMIDQRLTLFHQLFSWTSVGPPKFPIDKIVSLQGHLTVWRVLWVPSVLAKNSITELFLQMNKFWNEALKKCSLSFK